MKHMAINMQYVSSRRQAHFSQNGAAESRLEISAQVKGRVLAKPERVERPDPCSAALFVVLKGPARRQRITPAGLRSLLRHYRRTTGVQLANPQARIRFR